MAKAKSTDQIFNDMVQQEMATSGRSPEVQAMINRGREAGYIPTGTRSDAMLDAVTRGHVLNTPWQSDLQPQAREQLTQHQADELYNFARGNNMAGNGQGFSSRDYLNAVDLFDKYMKGETNDTSWSDFFDKHGLKPISRSNLEKRYRASWDSDAGKGQGPVPTGEQQAIMQQVAQAQQPQVAQQVPAQVQTQTNWNPSAEGSTEYVMNSPEENLGLDYASNYSAPPTTSDSATNVPYPNSKPLGIRFNHSDGTNTDFVGGYWNPAGNGREASLSIVMPQRDYGSVSNDIIQGIEENNDGGLLGRIRNGIKGIYKGTKFNP